MGFGCDPWSTISIQLCRTKQPPTSRLNTRTHAPSSPARKTLSQPSLLVNFFYHSQFSTSAPWQLAIVVSPCNYSKNIAKSRDKSFEFCETTVTSLTEASVRENPAGVQVLQGTLTLLFNRTPTSVIPVGLPTELGSLRPFMQNWNQDRKANMAIS